MDDEVDDVVLDDVELNGVVDECVSPEVDVSVTVVGSAADVPAGAVVTTDVTAVVVGVVGTAGATTVDEGGGAEDGEVDEVGGREVELTSWVVGAADVDDGDGDGEGNDDENDGDVDGENKTAEKDVKDVVGDFDGPVTGT